MIFFIVIFFGMVIAIGASSVLGFSFYLNRRARLRSPENERQIDELPPYRSLFEPTDEELRAREKEEKLQFEAKKVEERRLAIEEKIERALGFRSVWQSEPNKRNTLELLRLAAEAGSAHTFSEIAGNVKKVWDDNRIVELTANDLADLIDSHLSILPQQERSSGELFWLKQETQSLRLKTEVIL